MVAELYPENLKGLNLSFEESIYAIAFGLEKEIRSQGKEAVFEELDMTAEEMAAQVSYCLDEAMGEVKAYALRRVLGNLDTRTNDAKIFNEYHSSLSEVFSAAITNLQTSNSQERYYMYVSYRSLLLKDKTSECSVVTDVSSDEWVEQLYAQVQQLMAEVRFYDEKRDLALTKIKQLLLKIQQRKDCPQGLGSEWNVPLRTINLDGPITQIHWPYRSENVLRRLNLKTMSEVVEHFQDFKHFVKGDWITLWEWSVITSILRKAGLLTEAKSSYELGDEIENFDFSVRTLNALKRGGMKEVEDIIAWFVDGSADGWVGFSKLRNLGRASYEEIILKLSEAEIRLDEGLCYAMPASSVGALDFCREARWRLAKCKIGTVGELIAAYKDQNRFAGLRYIDKDLYDVARRQLKKYGFAINS